MKLLVLAQTPPPLHGQSAMIRLLLEELGRPGQGFELKHVNLSLSRSASDIGRWRLGKLFSLLTICARVLLTRWRNGPMALYYVPAPGKRGALFRDWVVMQLCRRSFTHLILHWHSVGLGNWLETQATPLERRITRKLLGNADLSIVLATELAADAEVLWPKRVAVVQNSRADNNLTYSARLRSPKARYELLFVGLCSRSKGLFDAVDAIALLHARSPGAFRLTVAGSFDHPATENEFNQKLEHLGDAVRYVGFANDEEKAALFAETDLLVFPTAYPHEGQPLVLIEAMAHDLPIVTTRWRAIPGMLPPTHVWCVEPGRPEQVADAILAARRAGPPQGVVKEHYLLNFTPAQHITALKKALLSLAPL